MDYQANSAKSKNERLKLPQHKKPKFDSVVESKTVIRKKTIGEKAKDIVDTIDVPGVVRYVVHEVMIPAARNMLVDASIKGVQRIAYGDQVPRRPQHGIGRVPYDRVGRGSYSPSAQSYRDRGYTRPSGRRSDEDFILVSRRDADRVLDTIHDIVDQYGMASLADLKEIMGHPISPVDNNWGWENVRGARVKQVREGYLLDLPPLREV